MLDVECWGGGGVEVNCSVSLKVFGVFPVENVGRGLDVCFEW